MCAVAIRVCVWREECVCVYKVGGGRERDVRNVLCGN